MFAPSFSKTESLPDNICRRRRCRCCRNALLQSCTHRQHEAAWLTPGSDMASSAERARPVTAFVRPASSWAAQASFLRRAASSLGDGVAAGRHGSHGNHGSSYNGSGGRGSEGAAAVVPQERLRLARTLHHAKADLSQAMGGDSRQRTLLHEAALEGDVASIVAMLPVRQMGGWWACLSLDRSCGNAQ